MHSSVVRLCFDAKVEFHHSNASLPGASRMLLRDVLSLRLALALDLDFNLFSSFKRALCSTTVDTRMLFEDFKLLGQNLCRVYNDSPNSSEVWASFKAKSVAGLTYKWTLTTSAHLFDPADPVGSFFRLRQWYCFDSKLNIEGLDTAQLFEQYKDHELRLEDRVVPEHSLESSIISYWLRDFSPWTEGFLPSHGPGATRECPRGTSPVKKCLSFKTDYVLEEVSMRSFLGTGDELMYKPEYQVSDSWRTSKLIFVPKSPLTYRSISAEPTSLQWYQQSTKNALVRYLNRTEFRSIVDFADQERSRQRALCGSSSGEFDTLDLSSASDDVTLQLVTDLFDGTTIVPLLVGTRSYYTEYGSERIRLRKFAPMGSALCFPIESIVFAAICMAAAVRTYTSGVPKGSVMVYGDDIIVRKEVTPLALDGLRRFGFSVNSAKSFWGGSCFRFREACGIEALNGHDVTPLRISRSFYHDDVASPSYIVVLSAFCNRSLEYGYTHLRRALLHLMERAVAPTGWSPKKILRSRPDAQHVPSACLHASWPSELNWAIPHRWNSELQRTEVRAVVPVSASRSSPEDPSATVWHFCATSWKNSHGFDEVVHQRSYEAIARDYRGLGVGCGLQSGDRFQRWRHKWVSVPI